MSIKIAMVLPFNPREIEYIIAWKPEAVWPDEKRVLEKLRQALAAGEGPSMSPLQVRIVLQWAEEQTSGHYGGGQTRNPEEHLIIGKLDAALDSGG